MKKTYSIILTILIMIGAAFAVTYFMHHKNIVEAKYSKKDILNLKWISSSEKSEFLKEFSHSKNKDKVVEKAIKLENTITDFKKNEDLLINPSALKSISTYKPNLVDIEKKDLTASAITNDESKLNKLAKSSLVKIIKKAKSSSIDLLVNSAYRSYEQQKDIQKAMPKVAANAGESEHQTGLAVDFAQSGVSNFGSSSAYTWMKKNAYKFGFIQSFTLNNSKLTGEDCEEWHWRFIGPRYAKIYHDLAKKIKNITYNQFVDKVFGYKYVATNIYNSLSKLASSNDVTSAVYVNNGKVEKVGETSVVSALLDNVKKQKVSGDFSSMDDMLKTSSTQSSKFDITKLSSLLSSSYSGIKSYHVGEEQSSTSFDGNYLESLVFIAKNKYVYLSRKVSNANTHELLKQRDLVYQILNFVK